MSRDFKIVDKEPSNNISVESTGEVAEKPRTFTVIDDDGMGAQIQTHEAPKSNSINTAVSPDLHRPLEANAQQRSINPAKILGGIAGIGIACYCVYALMNVMEYNSLATKAASMGVRFEDRTFDMLWFIGVGLVSLLEGIWAFATCRHKD